ADGHIAVGALWRLYAEYPYMPRLRDRRVLDEGLTAPQLLWEQEGFALADDYDSESNLYRGLVLPSDGLTKPITDATLVVTPERARSQRAEDKDPDPGPTGETGGNGTGEGEGPVGGPEPGPDDPPAKRRFYGSKQLRTDRWASDFQKVFEEVLGPLAATQGVT